MSCDSGDLTDNVLKLPPLQPPSPSSSPITDEKDSKDGILLNRSMSPLPHFPTPPSPAMEKKMWPGHMLAGPPLIPLPTLNFSVTQENS